MLIIIVFMFKSSLLFDQIIKLLIMKDIHNKLEPDKNDDKLMIKINLSFIICIPIIFQFLLTQICSILQQFIFTILKRIIIIIIMKNQIKVRPQSKQRRQTRPTSLYVNSAQAQQYFTKGKAEQHDKNYQKAIDLYLRATMYDPNLYQAFCNMGSCYRSLGRYMQGRSHYRRSISIRPDDAISHYNLANIERIIGNYEAAIDHYQFVLGLKDEKQVSIGSLYLDSLVNIGICFKNQEQFDKASEYYEKASKVDPNDEVVLFNYAMCIMFSLQKINCDVYKQVVKQKAIKAEQMLTKLLTINPKNQMALLQKEKISFILNKNNQNISNIIQNLKNILKLANCSIKEEVNAEIQRFQKLKINKQPNIKKQQTNNKNVNIYDSPSSKIVSVQIKPLTEEQGIKLIQQNQIQQLKNKLQQLKDGNMVKHVLQLALHIALSYQSQAQFSKAVDIYNKYFIVKGNELPFDKLSNQGHKTVGQLLKIQGKFKESIKHYEHLSSKLKDKKQVAGIHNSLGRDYDEMGDKQMALKQYKIALQTQPESFQTVYNVGCCLHQAGNYQQSLKHFQKFLVLLDKATNLDEKDKKLYYADCLVTIASCSKQSPKLYEIYEKANNSIKQLLQNITQNTPLQLQSDKLLTFYLKWTDILQQKLAKSIRRSEQYISTKQKLLQSYMNLLQNQNCPDRDVILNNCSTIYYEEKLYINALANYNQISNPNALPKNNLALTYLHLSQHFMASQCIFKAKEEEPDDPVISFNFQIINWIYGLGEESRIWVKFPSNKENHMLLRLEYGMMLIDGVTIKLNELDEQASFQTIEATIKQVMQDDNILKLFQDNQALKIKTFSKLLKQIANELTQQTSDVVDQEMLALCLNKSINIDNDFQALMKLLKNIDNKSYSLIQTLIFLFIFTNKDKEQVISRLIQKNINTKQETILLQLDRRVTVTEQVIVKQVQLEGISDLIVNLCTWECQIENKLVTLIKIIEKYYYHSNFQTPLQIQYHFPRHDQIIDCNVTLSKVAFIIYHVLKLGSDIKPTGKNIAEMKLSLANQLVHSFQNKLKNQVIIKISLNNDFVPLSIYSIHKTKQDCIAFLKQLQKESSNKHEFDIGKDCNQIVIIISSLVKLRCQWKEQNSLSSIFRSISLNPLSLTNQSIIVLDAELETLKLSNSLAKQQLQAVESFRF